MGLLGLIHRTVLGEGPQQFSAFFEREEVNNHPRGRETAHRHSLQLKTKRFGKFLDVLAHSMLGLIDVYNLLPADVVSATTVSEFQTRLHTLLIEHARSGALDWSRLFSPRKSIYNHPLREMHTWEKVKRSIVPAPGEQLARQGDMNCVSAWLRFSS